MTLDEAQKVANVVRWLGGPVSHWLSQLKAEFPEFIWSETGTRLVVDVRTKSKPVIDDGGPAYPTRCDGGYDKGGTSVRMWLAGQVAGGLLARGGSTLTPDALAHQSFFAADALIAESKR